MPRPNSRMEIVAAMRRIRVRWRDEVFQDQNHTRLHTLLFGPALIGLVHHGGLKLKNSTAFTHNTKNVWLSDDICIEVTVSHAVDGRESTTSERKRGGDEFC